MRRSTLASRTNTILLKRLWRKRFPTPYGGGGSRERPSFGRCRRQRLVLRSTARRPSAAWSMSPDTRKLGAADALVATGRPADPQVQHPAPSSGSAQRSNAAWSRHSTNVLAVRQPCGGLKRCPTLYGAFPSCPYAGVTWRRWHVTLRNRQKWPKPVFPEMHVRCELRGCRVRPSVRHAASWALANFQSRPDVTVRARADQDGFREAGRVRHGHRTLPAERELGAAIGRVAAIERLSNDIGRRRVVW